MSDPVLDTGFATASEAHAHYVGRLSLETDCADVYSAMRSDSPGFVLVDTRSTGAYTQSHVPGSVSIPNDEMTPARMADYPLDTLFVTYCWGPHCNGACKGAANLAALGYRVKEMLGGMWGWEMEGYAFDASRPGQ